MIEKRVLYPERVRTINGSFGFLEHRFLRDGFWEMLGHHALLFYVFLVLVGDRKGLSYSGSGFKRPAQVLSDSDKVRDSRYQTNLSQGGTMSRLTKEQPELVWKFFKETGFIRQTAQKAGVSRKSVRRVLRQGPFISPVSCVPALSSIRFYSKMRSSIFSPEMALP